MEDVNISKYRASVVREGSKPASPGFVVSEGQSPTDPAGTGQNHLPVTIAPVSTALAITENQVLSGAGTVAQYIRGDGSLADFPESSGGGSSVSYYLNGSVNQGTIGGVAYKELSKVPILGAGTDFSINADGYIASFITDAGDPNLLEIPGGNWNFETYFSASSSGGTPTFYVELYKVSGTTATLIASSVTSPEFIAFGTTLTPYFSSLAVPTTTLALTDRLAVRYYVTHSGRTITLHTENNHLCQIITTFTTGLTALNGLTAQVQNFAVGTSGTDFNIASATATHTFNLPTASATNRGALSSGDWTTFNNKQNALGYVPVPETRTITINGTTQDLSANRTFNVGTVTSVGLSSATIGVSILSGPITSSGNLTFDIATASGSQNGLLSSTDWTTFNNKQNALTNPVTGTGTTNRLAKFTGASTIGNSNISDGGITILNENPIAGQFAWQFNGNTTTGLSFGASVVAGTNSSDIAFRVLNAAASSNYFVVRGDGNVGINTASPFTVTNQTSLSINGTSYSRVDLYSGGTRHGYFYGGSGYAVVGSTSSSTNGLQFETNGGTRLTIDNAGNLGLGVTPSAWGSTVRALQFENGASIASNQSTQVSFNNNVYAVPGTNDFYIANGFASRYIQFQGQHSWSTAPSGTAGNAISFTQAMTLTSGGNLLVGTTTDNGARLQVSGAATISSSVTAASGNILSGTPQLDFTLNVNTAFKHSIVASNFASSPVSSNTLDFRVANGANSQVVAMTLNGSGNVGIGTASPGQKLVVQESGDAFIQIRNNTVGQNFFIGALNGETRLNNDNNTPITMWVNGSERMRITSSGNVLIGTATDAGYKLDVNGTGRYLSGSSSTIGLIVGGAGGAGSTRQGQLRFGDAGSVYKIQGGEDYSAFNFMIGSGTPLIIASNSSVTLSSLGTGAVYSNGGTLTNTNPSDFNLKENIAPINYGLGEILQLNPVTFNWKNDTINQGKQYGFIAQEVQKIMPDLVKKGEYLGLDKEAIFTTLVKAIQELKQEIDTLKN